MLPFNVNATEQSMALMKGTLDNRYNVAGRGLTNWDPLQKSVVSTAANIVGYDLQAPARLLLPVITPIRNSLPRRSRAANPGTQANWKTINGINGFTDAGYNQMGWTNEGARAPQFTYSASNNSAAYQTIGVEDALTFEAESAAQGFEDANSVATFLLLQQMMIKEEMALLAGNNSLVLGTPATPTLTASGSGTSLTNTAYSVIVVALTVEGYANSSVAGGVATSKQITGPDGKVSTINGGSSNKSAAASVTPTAGQQINASEGTMINGAVAYAWYWGASGSELLGAITTINSLIIGAAATGTQNASAVTGDRSANNGSLGSGTNQVTAFNGLMSTTYAAGAAGNAYVSALATGTPGTGTKLTSTTKGTVTEIDTLLYYLWTAWKISPTRMYVNAQQQRDLSTLCLNTSSAPLLRINADSDGLGNFTSGAQLRYYTNFVTMDPNGVKIPVMLHPNVPPGTIFFQCEQLPSYYVNNETPQVAEVLTRRDYYRIDWPLVTRERQYGVYSEEVLAVYATFGFALLTNIAPL